MIDGKFFCHSCQRWHADSVKVVVANRRRPYCAVCAKKTDLNAHQDTVLYSLPRGDVTQAHFLTATRNKRKKARDAGGPYGKWPD